MIIDYDFRGKRVAIVGGGRETARKLRAFVEAGAVVRLVGSSFDEDAVRAAKTLRIRIERCAPARIPGAAFSRSDAVVVVSDDPSLGRKLRRVASRRRVLFYAGDDPEVSDWVQPAVRFAGPVAVAVSTGGESPIVAKSLADRLARRIGTVERLMVEVQSHARGLARRRIVAPDVRRRVLYAILEDPTVRAALSRGDLPRAKARARRLVLEASGRSDAVRVPRNARAP